MEPSSSNQACKHQFFVICEIIEERSPESYALELYHHHFEVAPRKGFADFDVNH
jgi:hypothetical protein